jgi:hypothetical protein
MRMTELMQTVVPTSGVRKIWGGSGSVLRPIEAYLADGTAVLSKDTDANPAIGPPPGGHSHLTWIGRYIEDGELFGVGGHGMGH